MTELYKVNYEWPHLNLIYFRYVWDERLWDRMSPRKNRSNQEPEELLVNKLLHVQPNAKVIVAMRRPEDRLWSDYNFYKISNKSAHDFHQQVVQAITWWKRCRELYALSDCAYRTQYDRIEMPSMDGHWAKDAASRLRISIYYAFVKRWLSVMPRQNILFVRFEDYTKDPTNYVSTRVLPFLGLSPFSSYSLYKIEAKMAKQNMQRVHKESMRNDTRHLLNQFFAPFNKQLSILLGDSRFEWND